MMTEEETPEDKFRKILLSEEAWQQFLEALDAPPRALPRLQKLLREPSILEEGIVVPTSLLWDVVNLQKQMAEVISDFRGLMRTYDKYAKQLRDILLAPTHDQPTLPGFEDESEQTPPSS